MSKETDEYFRRGVKYGFRAVSTLLVQFCWSIAEEMRDDFELLNKLEELCGEEE